jgi:hypothetical protein
MRSWPLGHRIRIVFFRSGTRPASRKLRFLRSGKARYSYSCEESRLFFQSDVCCVAGVPAVSSAGRVAGPGAVSKQPHDQRSVNFFPLAVHYGYWQPFDEDSDTITPCLAQIARDSGEAHHSAAIQLASRHDFKKCSQSRTRCALRMRIVAGSSRGATGWRRRCSPASSGSLSALRELISL